MTETNIAIVGCGFVADYYVSTLKRYPSLRVIGVMDINPDRAAQFAHFHKLPQFDSLDALLADERVEIVLNLTNPDSHFAVSQSCLQADKHVYSEKPLAMCFEDAQTLVELAQNRGLALACAPCNVLSETAQSLWKALRENIVGSVRLVYAEMDDGLLHAMPYRNWRSLSGIPWPAHDEFEVGCTIEHAAYYVTWLVAFFGSVVSLTAFAATQVPDKQTDQPLTRNAPDLSVACLQFESGVVARLSCSIVAPHDHSLRVIGDRGVLSTRDCWFYDAPIWMRRSFALRGKTLWNPIAQRYPLVRSGQLPLRSQKGQQMDYARGVAELGDAIRNHRPPRLGGSFALHVNEVVLAIHNGVGHYQPKTKTTPMMPMPWAG